MTTALSPGVTLQPIDGGPTYYAGNGFTNAVNMSWDSPSFIPIGPWGGYAGNQTNVNAYVDVGWNTLFVPADVNLSMIQAAHISLIASVESGWTSYTNYNFTPGPETVGLETYDEPTTLAEGITTPFSTTPNSLQDGKFWWVNTLWSFASPQFGGLSPETSSAQSLSTPVTTPDGTQRHIDIQSLDMYWFTSANINWVQGVGGENVHNLGRYMTPDEVARGSNYGDMIDLQRAIQTQAGHNDPIFAYIENGGPDSSDTAAEYITPPEMNWAVWSSLIHGARGIIYFNTTFGGPAATTWDDLDNPYFKTIYPGQTTSIYAQTKATDAEVAQMAPVLNSPFALNYVSTPGGYNYGNGFDNTMGGIETAAHFYNGNYYIFADTRDSMTQTNISATFTLNDPTAVSVTVINENRTIPVVNGAFSDTFANASTVHIYQVNDGGSTVAFSPETAGTIVYTAEYGSAPSASELGVLVQFTNAQYVYGQQIGVMDPAVYAYQSLGVALASTATRFQNTFGPSNPDYPASPAGDTQFATDAYASIFGHPAGPAQIQQFVAQLNFFETLYTSTGGFGSPITIDLLARGAVYGQMLGIEHEIDPTAIGDPSGLHASIVGTATTPPTHAL